ncbi:MAG: TonB-dependent receptor [Bacteroidetes bacterium GWF2_33_16]|nr:MAG: TonB-dependent receptor [Bacteroidetes bacterium GWE2_32_14]OFY03058.1 MAG: TonB-dependent receptor [Bacteroidetes bacterium GWF2_33_16]
MRKLILTTVIVIISKTLVFSQNINQTVRGSIIDIDNKLPLIGATVIIEGTNPIIGTTTDVEGNFRLESIPIGRITLQLSYMGYESKTIPNIIVNSGKEVVLDLNMQESALKMEEVVVKAFKNKGETHNDMALVSARSISPEETHRFAGGYDDPSHILNNFAGVSQTVSGNNDIIVRGNSPKYIQWRLEGVEITNPVHQAEQNSSIAGFSMLNNKLLATSDFYTGAFSPEFGDVLSGVYDVKLRTGNNEKFESTTGVGLMGTDVTIEGPFKKGYAGSYLINYRYSTIGLLSESGIVDIHDVSTTFQDATFKVVLPTKRIGTFSFFGLGGLDNLKVKDLQQNIWQTPGNNDMMPDITQDFDQNNYMTNYGINHILTINNNSYIKTSLTYSGIGLNNDVFESIITKTDDGLGGFIIDTIDRKLNYTSRIITSTYRGSVTYSNKLNAKNKFQLGMVYSLINENNNQSQLGNDSISRFSFVDFNDNITTIKNFISWKHNFNNNIDLVAGFFNMNVLLNNKSTLEPRIALNWKLNNTSSIHAGYGKHSTMEKVHNYFTRIQQSDGSVTEPNKNIGLLKADHFVLGYEKYFTDYLRAKVELYYQYLYNLPVENNDTSYYATINEGSDYRYVPLVNKGTGKNYGIEMTLERFFSNHYYFLINGSLFDSKYKALDGVERNTKFNSNYLVNVLCGKEFDKIGKKKNQTLTINTKLFFSGGQRYIPLLRDANGELAVDPANNKFWDYSKAYDKTFGDFFSLNLSISYKFNRRKATHELFIDLNHLTNNQGKLSEYYDVNEPDQIGYITQMGFLPNVMYRVYF